MSFVDKFKKILFDEETEEVEVREELPERSPKSKRTEEKKEQAGFIEYHNEEEDTITELKLPKEEMIEGEKKSFNFPQDIDYAEESSSPSHSVFDDFDMDFMGDDDQDSKLVKDVNSFSVKNDDRRDTREVRDYRKILKTEEEVREKKPFTNTPVISPVWGILDKNYRPEEIVERKDGLTKVNTGVTSPRSFGPVSYNDQPLVPKKAKKVEEEEEKNSSLKEELVELNTTITDLINETIAEVVEDNSYEKDELAAIEESIQEEARPSHSLDDVVIKTENYDDIDDITRDIEASLEASEGIEIEKEVINNIEDAFESTSEFDSITENDAKDEEPVFDSEEDEEELVDLEALVDKKADDEDDSGLDNTIETDLFNLIDSMYKDNEDE